MFETLYTFVGDAVLTILYFWIYDKVYVFVMKNVDNILLKYAILEDPVSQMVEDRNEIIERKEKIMKELEELDDKIDNKDYWCISKPYLLMRKRFLKKKVIICMKELRDNYIMMEMLKNEETSVLFKKEEDITKNLFTVNIGVESEEGIEEVDEQKTDEEFRIIIR
jgi:hypothetical protein